MDSSSTYVELDWSRARIEGLRLLLLLLRRDGPGCRSDGGLLAGDVLALGHGHDGRAGATLAATAAARRCWRPYLDDGYASWTF